MIDELIEAKYTTQSAPLERFLTYLRTRKILSFVKDMVVLDFGCGSYLRTLRSIEGLAKARYGIDSFFKDTKPIKTHDGISVAGSFSDLRQLVQSSRESIDCIISLACFEHLRQEDLRLVLLELHKVSLPEAFIVGTVPTPPAKPVLEFLSYKLGLIDSSQIEDHKVYYDKEMLIEALIGTGWELCKYRRFQFGMNSFFCFKKLAQS